MLKKLTLALLTLTTMSASVVAQNAAEKSAIQQLDKSYNAGFDALDAMNFSQSYSFFKQCTDIVKANPGLKKINEPGANGTYGDNADVCQGMIDGGLFELADDKVNSDRMRDYLTQLKTLQGEDCYKMADAIISENPALAQVRVNGKIVGQIRKQCETAMVAANPADAGQAATMQQKYAPLTAQLAKVNANFKAAMNRPEKTQGDVLQKYQAARTAAQAIENLYFQIQYDDQPTNRAIKLGSGTVGSFIDDVRKSLAAANSSVTTLKVKADKAFGAQDAVVKAELPRILRGDKLAIYTRLGIPSDYSGGPVASKNGVYSGDGKSVAKDISTSTLWYYNDNGQGCTYKYWFGGNTVSKVEKPYGC